MVLIDYVKDYTVILNVSQTALYIYVHIYLCEANIALCVLCGIVVQNCITALVAENAYETLKSTHVMRSLVLSFVLVYVDVVF